MLEEGSFGGRLAFQERARELALLLKAARATTDESWFAQAALLAQESCLEPAYLADLEELLDRAPPELDLEGWLLTVGARARRVLLERRLARRGGSVANYLALAEGTWNLAEAWNWLERAQRLNPQGAEAAALLAARVEALLGAGSWAAGWRELSGASPLAREWLLGEEATQAAWLDGAWSFERKVTPLGSRAVVLALLAGETEEARWQWQRSGAGADAEALLRALLDHWFGAAEEPVFPLLARALEASVGEELEPAELELAAVLAEREGYPEMARYLLGSRCALDEVRATPSEEATGDPAWLLDQAERRAWLSAELARLDDGWSWVEGCGGGTASRPVADSSWRLRLVGAGGFAAAFTHRLSVERQGPNGLGRAEEGGLEASLEVDVAPFSGVEQGALYLRLGGAALLSEERHFVRLLPIDSDPVVIHAARFARGRFELEFEQFCASELAQEAGAACPTRVRGVPLSELLVLLRLEIDLAVLRRDRDGDGLSDALEIAVALDPSQRDSDGDGAADGVDANPRSVPSASWRDPRRVAAARALWQRQHPVQGAGPRGDGGRLPPLVGLPGKMAALLEREAAFLLAPEARGGDGLHPSRVVRLLSLDPDRYVALAVVASTYGDELLELQWDGAGWSDPEEPPEAEEVDEQVEDPVDASPEGEPEPLP